MDAIPRTPARRTTRAAPAWMVALVAWLAAGALLAGAARAETPTPMPTAGELAERLASHWVAQQKPDGTFPDYVTAETGDGNARDRYGPAMLAAGLLAHGTRTADDAALEAGFKSLRVALRQRDERQKVIFENLALSTAYNIARERLPDDPRFAALRNRLEFQLKRIKLEVFGTKRPYFNYYAVEAAGVLELLRSGLVSKIRGSVLHERDRSRKYLFDFLERDLPRTGAPGTTTIAGGAAQVTMASDRPASPQAYHAMTVAMLARVISTMQPERVPPVARQMLRQAALATWAFMGPDGDVSWAGRSQEQSWTLAMTAAGLELAAGEPGLEPTAAAAFRGAAERSMLRLSLYHSGGPGGLWVVPVFGAPVPISESATGVDGYTTATAYSGLTLLGLEWAAAAENDAYPRGPIGADNPTGFVLDRGAGTFATSRRGNVWFSVKQSPAPRVKHGPIFRFDMRYDAGLSNLKTLDRRGWRTIVPARPRTRGTYDSAGPLLRVHRVIARPVGKRTVVNDDGTISMDTAMTTQRGRVIRKLTFVFEPIACGVRIHVPALAGERWEFSGFFVFSPEVRSDGAVSDGRQSVNTLERLPAEVSFEPGYGSGVERLTRGRIRFVPATAPFHIDVCDAGG